ncbi:MAG: ADP-ribosylglycohydrolase family protein [Stenotrophomonas sp.]|uniref:ADP-ribosylglycohydrolase family protein n=1 Tax=Stenotrophomonas sp. TaxID=69392 RepID=UPI003D6CFB17
MIDLQQRYLGCLLGLACGDAVGTAVEFSTRGCFEPVKGMVGGGPFELLPGQWTDDTSMALCVAESLLECDGFDPLDQLRRYVKWWKHGHLSSTGECFDIGTTVAGALYFHLRNGNVQADTGDPMMAGNGSLMRLAPVVLWQYPEVAAAVDLAAQSSLTTHTAAEAVDCCRLLAVVICNALAARSKEDLLAGSVAFLTEPKVRELADGCYRGKSREQIYGSGYSVQSLEAALWCVHNTASFEQAILMAANLGDDADTTAAISGQIAGALYGVEGIPRQWLKCLHQTELIADFARRIHQHAGRVCRGAIS